MRTITKDIQLTIDGSPTGFRLTKPDAQPLSTYLTEYVRETNGVRDVTDIRFTTEKARFSWSCTVLTEFGPAVVGYEAGGG